MNHFEIWELEELNLAYTADELSYNKFLADVSTLTSIDNLDGDRSDGNPTPDACCLDELSDWFHNGWSPQEAAKEILSR